MTKDKKLLLIDLCVRLPYGVKVRRIKHTTSTETIESVEIFNSDWLKEFYVKGVEFKPYLRPMSSMTEEEKKVVCSMNMISDTELNERLNYQRMYVQNYTIETFDYFNEHHLDYRGLIPMGLALEAKEGMYEIQD